MPLVPGLLITNAVRDLMAGHFMSGLSKGAEAFLRLLQSELVWHLFYLFEWRFYCLLGKGVLS